MLRGDRMRWMMLVAAALLWGPVHAQEEETGKENRDLEVQVVLRNGAVMDGLALGGRLCERPGAKGYEPCESRSKPRAGIRLWYPSGMDGAMFILYRDVKEVRVVRKVSSGRVDEIRKKIRSRKKERSETGRRESGGPGSGEGVLDESQLDDEERALLERFPPSKGWGARRFGEINRRRIVEQKTPGPKEQAFVDAYEAWRAALNKARGGSKGGDGPRGGDGDPRPPVKQGGDAPRPEPEPANGSSGR